MKNLHKVTNLEISKPNFTQNQLNLIKFIQQYYNMDVVVRIYAATTYGRARTKFYRASNMYTAIRNSRWIQGYQNWEHVKIDWSRVKIERR